MFSSWAGCGRAIQRAFLEVIRANQELRKEVTIFASYNVFLLSLSFPNSFHLVEMESNFLESKFSSVPFIVVIVNAMVLLKLYYFKAGQKMPVADIK